VSTLYVDAIFALLVADVTAAIVWVVKGQGKVVGDGIRQQVQGAQAHRNFY
jgi:hypothetical protein